MTQFFFAAEICVSTLKSLLQLNKTTRFLNSTKQLETSSSSNSIDLNCTMSGTQLWTEFGKPIRHVPSFEFPHHTVWKFNDVLMAYCPTYLTYSMWTSSRVMEGSAAKRTLTFRKMELLPTLASTVPEGPMP